jgi:hypothetical protein
MPPVIRIELSEGRKRGDIKMTATKPVHASKNLARAANDNAPAKLDWSTADDGTLVHGAVDRDPAAWRELLARHRSTLIGRIRFTLARYSSRLSSNDTVEDIRSEVYQHLLSNEMGRLRAFNAQKGKLEGWLSMIAEQTTMRHMHRLIQRVDTDPVDEVIEGSEENGMGAGAAWVAHGEDHYLDLLDFKRFVDQAPSTMAPERVIKKFLATRPR